MKPESNVVGDYKFAIIFISIILIIVLPLIFLGPFLFGNLVFSSLSTTVKVLSFSSFFIGLWFLGAGLYLSKIKDKKLSIDLVKYGAGSELIIMILPIVIYKGTKSFLNSKDVK